jgi:uncharacterized lipoprotein YmbA
MLPIQQFSFPVLAEIVRRQPSSSARTTFAWQLAVGPALARVTVVTLTDGILTVQSQDPRWAQEIGRSRDIVLRRLQTLLGQEAVRTLSLRGS